MCFVVDNVALQQVFRQILRFSPVSIIPPCSILIFIYVLHLPRSLGTFQKAVLSRMSGTWDRKLVSVAAFVTSFA